MSMDASSLPDDPSQLRALLLEERAQHQAALAQIEATVSSQQRTIQQQEQMIARLLRRFYGPRQERIDHAEGDRARAAEIRLSRLPGARGLGGLAEPLYQQMCQLVLASQVIHTDDTPVKLLDPLLGHARTARFWAYVGDRQHPYSVYDFTDSRQRDGPTKFLQNFAGYLQADAYGGYDGIYAGGRVREVACWSHTRRYWWEARTTDARRAHHALGAIARLYQLETTFAELPADERRAARQEHALPIHGLPRLARGPASRRLAQEPDRSGVHLHAESVAGAIAIHREWRAIHRQQHQRTDGEDSGPRQKELVVRRQLGRRASGGDSVQPGGQLQGEPGGALDLPAGNLCAFAADRPHRSRVTHKSAARSLASRPSSASMAHRSISAAKSVARNPPAATSPRRLSDHCGWPNAHPVTACECAPGTVEALARLGTSGDFLRHPASA